MIRKKLKISYVIIIVLIIALSTLSYGVPNNAARTFQENSTVSNEVTTKKENNSESSSSNKDITNDDVFFTRSNGNYR